MKILAALAFLRDADASHGLMDFPTASEPRIFSGRIQSLSLSGLRSNKMFKAGDLVVFVRPHPAEAGLVHKVAKAMVDRWGMHWVLLVSEPADVPAGSGPVEVEPGVFGGLGCWEEAKEFKLAEANNA
tara:strand:+ start:382 stop:765 length:384 start_codon:yes stop_codon:yes gene_type:complete